MPKIIYTAHAQERIAQRKIKIEWIEEVLSCPKLTVKDTFDSALLHFIGVIVDVNKESNVLRVVTRMTEGNVFIITAYFDRRLRGKL
ncbi:MAG: DUF4258 domain-containing protein [Pseudomonadota bacterium]